MPTHFVLQGNPPTPKDEEVKLVDAPGVTVYVKVKRQLSTIAGSDAWCCTFLCLSHLACRLQLSLALIQH